MINTIDLFAGCGGLTEGFNQEGSYSTLACVEWDKLACETLQHRLKTKWNYLDADKKVLRFDMQRTEELLNGWDNSEYGTSIGLDKIISGKKIDLIIGGPPCQAYSVAGRIRDLNGMKDDYRNYLFESYIKIVKHYQPKAFIFENVVGILSAKPGNKDVKIIDIIKESFNEVGYVVLNNLKDAVINLAEYGVPQNRKRIIILGLSKKFFGNEANKILESFYKEKLPKYKTKNKITVEDAIGDLPKLYPLEQPIIYNGKKYSHSFEQNSCFFNHKARFNSLREIEIFKLLTQDIESGECAYTSIDKLKALYTKTTGKTSNIHKYYVLRKNELSNTIPAHLYKDGLRHIHHDSHQARSITVREAARLQTFPDDFAFISNSSNDFKMIGNAVPPLFAKILATAIKKII